MGNDSYKPRKRACIVPPANESNSFDEYIRAIRVDRSSVNFPTVPSDERLTVRPGRKERFIDDSLCFRCEEEEKTRGDFCQKCYTEIGEEA